MPRKVFKRWMPKNKHLTERLGWRWLKVLSKDPHLFHLNRHSVSSAFFIGLFIAFLPIMGQFFLAAVCAIIFRANLPISMALIWVSNPLTFPVIFVAAYKFGAHILLIPPRTFDVEFSLVWLQSEFSLLWQPLLLGSLLFSLFFSCLGYVSIQWLWRWHVLKRWRERQARNEKKDYS